MIRATVSPPTAMHRVADGQATEVNVMGMYEVRDARNVRPASVLWATAPTSTAGKPYQSVPTIAHCSAEGQAIPYTSSTGSTAVARVQVWPPSSLRSNSPLAGTTSLTVVPVVPAARQTEAERQVVDWSTPSPEGTDASAHVCPPSALTATAPCPWLLLVGT